jgi:hypothetical protein
MPKAIDSRECAAIFPEFMEFTLRNEQGATDENPNFIDLKVKLKLLDAGNEELTVRIHTKRLWSGTAFLTAAQVTNNLESAVGTALTQARVLFTGA